MDKRLIKPFSIITAACLFFSAAHAEETCHFTRNLSDQDGYLSSTQKAALSAQLELVSLDHGVATYICITESRTEKPFDLQVAQAFQITADEPNSDSDRVLLYINMSSRMMDVKANGVFGDELGASVLPILAEAMREDLSEGRIPEALQTGVGALEQQLLVPFSVGDQTYSEAASEFGTNVVLFFFAHELGHAVMQEFDIPTLSNQEVVADSFANYWLYTRLGDLGQSIILDSVEWWVLQDAVFGVTSSDFRGSHDVDIRRGYWQACLFYGFSHLQNVDQIEVPLDL